MLHPLINTIGGRMRLAVLLSLCPIMLPSPLEAGDSTALAGPEKPAPVNASSARAAALGIPVFPGAELLRQQDPAEELVNLSRPGWEFVKAETAIADFLVRNPLRDLWNYYHRLCVRDPLLSRIKENSPPGEIVAVFFGRRQAPNCEECWLRIVRYRRQPVEVSPQRDGR